MSEIEFICISDTHFGSYNSLLTNTDLTGNLIYDSPSPMLSQLAKVLEKIVSTVNKKRKARFILNGDIFELALSNTNESVMTFDFFVQEIFKKDRKDFFSEKMIFIPGNHDHHLWETARERQYLEYMTKMEVGEFINLPWHHTRMIRPSNLKSRFITTLMQRHKGLKSARALTVYPNLTIVNRETEKYLVFSHGHFIESLYFLMSDLSAILLNTKVLPKTIDEIERENFAWIDFFWSVLGRSGKVGTNIGIMYDMLQDEKSVQMLSQNLVTHLLKRGDIPDSIRGMLNPIVSFALSQIVTQIAINERGLTDEILGKQAIKGLYSYINGPLRLQFLEENKNILPKNMDFIFGHTHKPFSEIYTGFQEFGYPDSIGVYNTGGWVIDTILPQSQTGGAILLVDEEKNVVLMKLYKEKGIHFSLESCNGEEENPFLGELKEKMNFNNKIFTEFSEITKSEMEKKRSILEYRIKKNPAQ